MVDGDNPIQLQRGCENKFQFLDWEIQSALDAMDWLVEGASLFEMNSKLGILIYKIAKRHVSAFSLAESLYPTLDSKVWNQPDWTSSVHRPLIDS